MRFLVRFSSFVVLAAAVVAAAFDSIRSVARSAPDLMPLGKVWADFSPQSFDWLAQAVAQGPQAERMQKALTWLLLQPAFAVLATLALLLWILAWRRKPAAGRFAA